MGVWRGGDDDNKPLPATTAVDVRPERPRKGVAYRSRGSFGLVNSYEEGSGEAGRPLRALKGG